MIGGSKKQLGVDEVEKCFPEALCELGVAIADNHCRNPLIGCLPERESTQRLIFTVPVCAARYYSHQLGELVGHSHGCVISVGRNGYRDD